MKIFSMTISVILSMMLSGCWGSDPTPCEPVVVDRIVYKTKIVKVPVKCDIPKPTCSFKGDGYEPGIKAIECVIKQKRYIEACSKGSK